MVVPYIAQWYIDSEGVVYMDTGRAPRWLTDFGFQKKMGTGIHIPVASTLEGLTNYINGGNAQGDYQVAIGREIWNWMGYVGQWIPLAWSHQYMPIVRTPEYPNGCSPWAQGALNAPTAPIVASFPGMNFNGVLYSLAHVAMSGAEGVTDAQFNSSVLWRCYFAGFSEFEINPYTQVWHSELDSINRRNDPGWPGELEDAMQDAARRIMRNSEDIGGLRGLVAMEAPAPPPEPQPEPPAPEPTLPEPSAVDAIDFKLVQAQQMISDARAHVAQLR